MEAGLDVAVEPFVVVGDREGKLLARGDVDVYERPGNVRVAEPAPEIAITEQLPPVALDAVPGGAEALGGEISRLELLDQPRILRALHATVQATGEHRRPVIDRHACLEVDFAAVGGVRLEAQREHAGMNLGPQAQAPPPVAAVEADAPEAFLFGELAHRDLERFRDGVESQRGLPLDCRRKSRDKRL
ncbi:MAG TPA: hypothetical protein VFF17_11060 [Thermoanaerobaculia bacterium]|nr:hypothetical protein [Thermoanaerobaculia bacterium]